jgi:type IV pilus assembly protein PilC
MKFAYKAFDLAGKAAVGTIDANDAGEAREALRKRGLFATEVFEQGAGKARAVASNARQESARLSEVAGFTREMAILISTGTPLVEALKSLERQCKGEKFRGIVGELCKSVEQGESLSEAMARYPRAFDGVACSLVRAGEEGGNLDAMMDRLSRLLRQVQRVRGALIGAMIYPALLITVALSVLAAMVGFVLPKFEDLFKTLQAPLPGSTKALLAIGAFVKGNWWGVLIALAVIVGSTVVYMKSEAGRRALHQAMVRLPGVGRIVRAFSVARISRVLGVLVEGRVPLLDALRLTRASVWSRVYAELVDKAEQSLVRGEPLYSAFTTRPGGVELVTPSVVEALRNAEKSGRLGSVLMSVADHMDEDNDLVVKSLTSIVEPLILIVLGLIVGVVAISMFLPLFDLTAANSHG